MNVEEYLLKQGWKKGEPLRPGGIKKPVLVAHKKDTKGLGFNPQASEGWWERMFDGHLKALDFSSKDKSQPKFEMDAEKKLRATSPLYASFQSGGMLEGTLGVSNVSKKSSKEHSKEEKSKKSKKSHKKKSLKRKNEDSEDSTSKKHKSDKHHSHEKKKKSKKS